MLGPRRNRQSFRLRTQSEINRLKRMGTTNFSGSKASMKTILVFPDEEDQVPDEGMLLATVQRSPDVRKMLLNRYLIVVLGSAVHLNIDKKLRKDLVPDFQELVDKDEMKVIHVSQRKIEAMEDSVLFAPYLYRLQKSVVVTEPADSLFGEVGRVQVRGAQADAERPPQLLQQNNTMPAAGGQGLGGSNAASR